MPAPILAPFGGDEIAFGAGALEAYGRSILKEREFARSRSPLTNKGRRSSNDLIRRMRNYHLQTRRFGDPDPRFP